MNKLKTRITVLSLSLLLVVGMLTGQNVLNANTYSSKDGYGNHVIGTKADGVTGVPDHEDGTGAGPFNQAEGDGRIWVDKSVSSNGDGTFKVDLSALTQQYLSTTSTMQSSAVAADVVFVLDGSGSMVAKDVQAGQDQYTRMEAMVYATNEAIDIILKANPENRIAVYVYQKNTVHTLLKLDRYSVENAIGEAAKKFFTYKQPFDSMVTMQLNSNLVDRQDNKVSFINGGSNFVDAAGGTPTQAGVAKATQDMLTEINRSKDLVERTPFVFLLSDGGATFGNSQWNNPSSIIGNPNQIGNGTEYQDLASFPPTEAERPLAEITANLILTSSYMQDQLTEAYNNYNNKNGKQTQYENKFYSVGLGSEINGPYVSRVNDGTLTTYLKYAWAGLNPSYIEEVENGTLIDERWNQLSLDVKQDYLAKTQEAAAKVKGLLQQYATEKGKEIYATKEKIEYNHYYEYAESYDALDKAFQKLSNDVAKTTQTIKSPVTEESVNGSKASIYFSDIIGDGMEVDITKPIQLKGIGNKIFEGELDPNEVNTNEKGTYKFEGLEGKVVIRKDSTTKKQIVEWYVTAKDMVNCLILRKDTGVYSNETPLNLSYHVKLKSDAKINTINSFYTNNFITENGKILGNTEVSFSPNVDNSYYYYTNSKVGIVGTLQDLEYPLHNDDIAHYVKGDIVGATAETELRNVYMTSNMASAIEEYNVEGFSADIGSIVSSIDVTKATGNFKIALQSTIHNAVTATDAADTNAYYAFKTGTPKVHDHTLGKDEISQNITQTADLVSQENFKDGVITMKLGNNGRLDVLYSIEKTAPLIVEQGETLTYKIRAYNKTESEVKNIVVEDILPTELSNFKFDNTSNISAVHDTTSGNVKWTILKIDANQFVDIVFTMKVPESVAKGTVVRNTSKITTIDSSILANAATSNTTETTIDAIKTNKVNVTINKDDNEWNDSGKAVTLKDGNGNIHTNLSSIPAGNYTVLVDGEDIGNTITVSDSDVDFVLDYYTLILNGDIGVENVSGEGIYLKGTTVDINAILKPGFQFNGWTGTTQIESNTSSITMNGRVELNATTQKIDIDGPSEDNPGDNPDDNPGDTPSDKGEDTPKPDEKKDQVDTSDRSREKLFTALFAASSILFVLCIVVRKRVEEGKY